MVCPFYGEDGNLYDYKTLLKSYESGNKFYPKNPSLAIKPSVFKDPNRKCRYARDDIQEYVRDNPDSPETIEYLQTFHGLNFLNFLFQQKRYALAASFHHGPSMLVLADSDPSWLEKAFRIGYLNFDRYLQEMHVRHMYTVAANLGYAPSMVALADAEPESRRYWLMRAHEEGYDPATLRLAREAKTPEEAVYFFNKLNCLTSI